MGIQASFQDWGETRRSIVEKPCVLFCFLAFDKQHKAPHFMDLGLKCGDAHIRFAFSMKNATETTLPRYRKFREKIGKLFQ